MSTSFLETAQQQLQEEPLWKLAIFAWVVAYALHSFVGYVTAPRNRPPFYYELPYIPWLGSLVQFAINPRDLIERATAANKSTNCFTVHLFGTSMTFLTGSEGHAHFFKAREQVFDIREAYAMTVITFGPGVCYDCPQKKMAEQFAFFKGKFSTVQYRGDAKTVTFFTLSDFFFALFSFYHLLCCTAVSFCCCWKDGLSDSSFVKYMQLVQEETVQYFEKHWGDSGEADLLQTLSDLFTLTSSRCLLGDEIRAQWNESGMAQHYLALDHSFVPILFFFPSLPNPHRSKCVAARELFKQIFQQVIENRRKKESAESNYVKPKDYLQVLMDAKYKDGTPLTMTEITGNMIGILLGGQHTSNVTGTWCLSHLLKEPKWMQAVMEEQRQLLPAHKHGDYAIQPSTLTYDQVNKEMPVMDQILSETLRLHPPFFQLSRKVKEDSVFQGMVIPKGHIVNISPAASMRNPDLWENPNQFDPTRFAPENKDNIQPYAWIPFGGGTIVLAVLYRRRD
jgi:sterol 14alpha-demethylase